MHATVQKISVIIPVYNNAEYLEEALDSVLAQTCPLEEIIMVDDGSTDDSKKIIESYQNRPDGAKIKYVYQENRGPSAARNTGIRMAQGDWIAFLDADDMWFPEKIKIQMEYVTAHEGVGFLASEVTHDSSVSRIPEAEKGMVPARQFVFDDLIIKNHVGNPSMVIVKKALLEKAGMFREESFAKGHFHEDYSLWLRLSKLVTVHKLNVPTTFVRLTSGGLSTRDRGAAMKKYLAFLKDNFRDEYPEYKGKFYNKAIAYNYFECAIEYTEMRHYLQALVHLFLSVAYYPFRLPVESDKSFLRLRRLKTILEDMFRNQGASGHLGYLVHRWISWWSALIIYKIRYGNQGKIDADKVSKILVISLDYIGDNILSSPAISVLKEKFPQAKVWITVGQWSKDLYKAHPLIDRIVPYNCNFLNRSGERWSISQKLAVIRKLRKERFDLIVDLRGSLGTLLLAVFKASPYRVDRQILFARDILNRLKRKLLKVHDVPLISETRPEQVLDALKQVGITTGKEIKVSFYVDEEDRKSIRDILKEENADLNNKIVSLHPRAADPLKLWPNKKWANIADALAERYSLQVVFSGTQGDRKDIEDIIAQMKNKPVNLAGKIKLMEMAALIELSSLCIGLDSGPVHIAGALNVPVIAMYGPDHPDSCSPWTDRKKILFHALSDVTERMNAISSEEVLVAAEGFLRGNVSMQEER